MVRLLQPCAVQFKFLQLGFNPTMVRLLQLLFYWTWVQTELFQSHNGAIAALYAPTS